MQGTVHPAVVTPSGVRDGDPDALDALCRRRGASVLAYCAALCSEEDAERAAAEAFARFRAAVVAIDDIAAIDPEALLLSATRHAAASLAQDPAAAAPRRRLRHAPRWAPSPACERVPELLLARAEARLRREDQEFITGHLERCSGCSHLRDAFRRAELAYREPPERLVPPGAASTIVAALVAAAPVAAAAEPVLTDEDYAPVAGESDDFDVVREAEAERRGAGEDEPNAPAPAHSMARTARKPHPPAPQEQNGLRAVVLPGAIIAAAIAGALVIAGVFSDEGSAPPTDPSGDQLFPAAVIRAPERGTAAAAAAEIARQARVERLRIARERAARRALGPGAAVPATVPGLGAPGAAAAQSAPATSTQVAPPAASSAVAPGASATGAPTAP